MWQWLLGKRKKSKIAALERGGDGSQCLVLKVKQMSLYITITDSDAQPSAEAIRSMFEIDLCTI